MSNLDSADRLHHLGVGVRNLRLLALCGFLFGCGQYYAEPVDFRLDPQYHVDTTVQPSGLPTNCGWDRAYIRDVSDDVVRYSYGCTNYR
jgi:hypothetical protein